jgi:hypothetical protein
MFALPGRIESEAGRPLAPQEIFDIAAARETRLSRLLMLYISTGLVFMLLPGTFLGVWNLLAISSRRATDAVSPQWVQAHGHAQIFGWIGTFILGIGFYSIPKLRRAGSFALSGMAACWVMWTTGVALQWFTVVYRWPWRILFPLAAAFQLLAFLIFLRTVAGHRPQGSVKFRPEAWMVSVFAGSAGFLLALLLNLGIAVSLALNGRSPQIPQGFNQRFLVLQTWGFLVPFVWGFSAKWLPIFLGLRPLRARTLRLAIALNSLAVAGALTGKMLASEFLLLAGIVAAITALRIFEPGERPPKVRGVHSSFPFFVRLAYGWAAIAAALGLWAVLADNAPGIAGASRHALTVGFLAMMVFAIGQRVLPAFSGMRLLFSPRLMLAGLLLLAAGCMLRVGSEILAYQGWVVSAWTWLPVSAVLEMAAVLTFACNLSGSFLTSPPSAKL